MDYGAKCNTLRYVHAPESAVEWMCVAVLITVSQLQQWANIRFFCKPRKSGIANPVGLTSEAVYGDKTLKTSTVYNWFKNGHKSL
jgi:hypothetical protein